MSDTIVDMAKVTQMLDAWWTVTIFKGGLGSYEVRAQHETRMEPVRKLLVENMRKNTSFLDETGMTAEEAVENFDFHDGWLMTDDWTPQQALTRCAYKVHGEIL